MSENCECNDFEEEVNDLKGELEQLREEFEELNERLQGKKEHRMPSTDDVESRWHKSEIISRYRDGIEDIYDELNKRYQSFYELKEFERVCIIPLNECQDRVLKCSEKMTIEDLYECIMPPSKSLTIYALIPLNSPLYFRIILERPRLNAVKWILYRI
jgi:hypothetical protein